MNDKTLSHIVSSLPKKPERGNGRIMLLQQGIKARINASKRDCSITLEDGRTYPANYKRLQKSNPRFDAINIKRMKELFDWKIYVHDIMLFTANRTMYHWECAQCHHHGIGYVTDMAAHLETHGHDIGTLPDMTGAVFVLPYERKNDKDA